MIRENGISGSAESELEKRMAVKRMRDGRREKARQGGYAGAAASTGVTAMSSWKAPTSRYRTHSMRFGWLDSLRDKGVTLRALADEGFPPHLAVDGIRRHWRASSVGGRRWSSKGA